MRETTARFDLYFGVSAIYAPIRLRKKKVALVQVGDIELPGSLDLSLYISGDEQGSIGLGGDPNRVRFFLMLHLAVSPSPWGASQRTKTHRCSS